MDKINKSVLTFFPDAGPVNDILNKYFSRLTNEYDMQHGNTIAAASVCPDELNQNTLDEVRRLFGDYFSLGGLSGFPFTGITGLRAFFDHVPDNGDALVFFGPHMAVDSDGIGMIKRPGQSRKTLTCGSLITAFNALNDCVEEPFLPSGDHQQLQVFKMLLLSKDAIPELKPHATLAAIICKNSYKSLKRNIQSLKNQFTIRKVYLLGGIIINTPDKAPDYLQIKFFEAI